MVAYVFACFVDFNKAFDNVDYWLLFSKMLDLFTDIKVHSFVRLLASWYSSQSAYVRWQSSVSGSFGIEKGVRQGGILSPYLFRLYVRDLTNSITSMRVGCNVTGIMVNILCYADDMVLLAPSWLALQTLITVLHDNALDIDMTFNVNKTVCMVCKPLNRKYLLNCTFPAFTAGRQTLCFVDKFKYLGHIIQSDLGDGDDIRREIRSTFTRCNIIISRFMRCTRFVKLTLFRAYCMCLFGTALWTNYPAYVMRLFVICYNKCIKRFFGFSKYHSVSDMLVNLGLPCAQTLLHNSLHNFKVQLVHCGNSIVEAVSLLTDRSLIV
jgi:hypothetical protein